MMKINIYDKLASTGEERFFILATLYSSPGMETMEVFAFRTEKTGRRRPRRQLCL